MGVQIYVPSPQSTPYSTISKSGAESHRSITFLSYSNRQETASSLSEATSMEMSEKVIVNEETETRMVVESKTVTEESSTGKVVETETLTVKASTEDNMKSTYKEDE